MPGISLDMSSKDNEEESSESEYSDIDEREAAEEDSDVEIQNAFAKGKLKPGLHVLTEKLVKEHKNDVRGLQQKLSEFQRTMPWIERLDITCKPAPVAPELGVEILEHAKMREKHMKLQNKRFSLENDPVHNDFKREMTFYRQAQEAVMEGFKCLKKLNLPTTRPDDYFAEMAKSDDLMQKVRRRLMQKQIGKQISERVKKIREIKKYGKKVQVEVELQKQKEKREMLEKIKKFRKGKTDTIDFLEKGPLRKGTAGTKSQAKKEVKRSNKKRIMKDKKYGYGGKKWNLKRNDSESYGDVRQLPAMRKPGAQNKKRKSKSKGKKNKGRSRK
ncbi:probable rRNA-processing protein EBP2 homolog [Panulirus ornatus]|uniref:probable rRNA-processing protein EBP2 homolog n=1 Tax=Panulirus ornatus TaxID=150431 RepID=UPI003A8417A6